MNTGITEETFNLIISVKKLNPKMSYAQIGLICGVSGSVAGKAIKAGEWHVYEDMKKKHLERYSNGNSNKQVDQVKQEQKTMIISFDQVKALAKDVDQIKQGIDILCRISGELLNQWKGY